MKTRPFFGLLVLGSTAALALALSGSALAADKAPPADSLATKDSDLEIYPIHHATLALQWQNKTMAFVCMNLPYTMDVDQAARAVRAFKPRIVYPYHYRGADLEQFKRLVGTNSGVEVRLRD